MRSRRVWVFDVTGVRDPTGVRAGPGTSVVLVLGLFVTIKVVPNKDWTGRGFERDMIKTFERPYVSTVHGTFDDVLRVRGTTRFSCPSGDSHQGRPDTLSSVVPLGSSRSLFSSRGTGSITPTTPDTCPGGNGDVSLSGSDPGVVDGA